LTAEDTPHGGRNISLSARVNRAVPAGGPTSVIVRRTDGVQGGVGRVGGGEENIWKADAALLDCGDDGEFARWFASNQVGGDWHRYVWRVPVGRIYQVVDEARRRAASWTDFASLLESRTR
jgi:hypothetical protein